MLDRQALHRICALIPRGRWTTYGDLADAVGAPGRARHVARELTRGGLPNAHRVLRSTGRVAQGFRHGDCGGPEVARRTLEDEGLVFDPAGTADPARRWVPSPPVRPVIRQNRFLASPFRGSVALRSAEIEGLRCTYSVRPASCWGSRSSR